jgi:multiple sugar transport system substrate-binding protein
MLMYYRKDLFSDPAIQKDFQRRYGHPLGDPRHYDTQMLLDAARYFTQTSAPRLYGMAPFTPDTAWAWFQVVLRHRGGQFFDPQTMRAKINDPQGVFALNLLMELGRTMPPGSSFLAETRPGETTFGTYLSGKAAMASFWPPLGRWAERYDPTLQSFGMIPATQVKGKTGYALLPDQQTEIAVGFLLTVPAESRHKEAAYLFIQWLNSKEVSLQRVMLPYALRDPFRFSHFQSEEYRRLWPGAAEYLAVLKEAAMSHAWKDLSIPGANTYTEAFFEALGRAGRGVPVADALNRMAAEWDELTMRLGVESQRKAYAEFLKHQHAGTQ